MCTKNKYNVKGGRKVRINANIQSLTIYNGYKNNLSSNSVAINRISSGKKLNSAKDNPIKIEQNEKFKMQIRALEMANKNVQDTTSMLQVADAAMSSISEVLIRMKELAVQGMNGTNTEEDKEVIESEINQLKEYIDEAAKNTEFNGNKILANEKVSYNSNPVYINMQTGANVGDVTTIPYFNLSTEVLGIADLDVTTIEGASKALEDIDEALRNVNSCRSAYGAIQSRLESTAEIISSGIYTYTKSHSDICDADIAMEMANVAKTSVLIESATAIMAQTNNFPKDVLNILANVIK